MPAEATIHPPSAMARSEKQEENQTSSSNSEFTKLGLPEDFPPEILARILRQLSYAELLTILRGTKKWKAVAEGDPDVGVEIENDMDNKLGASGVVSDVATIPAVHTFTIRIEEDFSYQVKVENSKGIRVINIFTELAKA
ncbi:hypothetical protein FB451DRAFT_1179679 [Mycena latifolia]|nr:hypothetical protein FB451DRAFT_1179679 [Mycena latifolia]